MCKFSDFWIFRCSSPLIFLTSGLLCPEYRFPSHIYKNVSKCVVLVVDSDHVRLQVAEGWQVEEVLDEVGWRRLTQPQEHGVSIL